MRSAEPLIVYRVAYSSLVKSPDGKSVPKTVAHLYEEFGTEDVRSFIAEREAPVDSVFGVWIAMLMPFRWISPMGTAIGVNAGSKLVIEKAPLT